MIKNQKAWLQAVAILVAFLAGGLFFSAPLSAGDLEPPGTPDSTMKTLDQIPPSWSQTLPANAGDPCDSSRFECVLGGEAVLDKETGLVWAKNANLWGGQASWINAQSLWRSYNLISSIGSRKGWRAPTVDELASLLDMSVTGVWKLPYGHPFQNVQQGYYWTSTEYEGDTTQAYYVNFYNGVSSYIPKTYGGYVWPVRGGNGK